MSEVPLQGACLESVLIDLLVLYRVVEVSKKGVYNTHVRMFTTRLHGRARIYYTTTPTCVYLLHLRASVYYTYVRLFTTRLHARAPFYYTTCD